MCEGECGMGCGDLLDRRSMIVRGAVALAGVWLAACSDSTGPDLTGSFTVQLATYPALATVGGVAMVSGPGGYPVAVVRTETGYLALSRVCPHQGSTIGLNGDRFVCPNHGATFTKQGVWTGGQRTSNMRQLQTSLDAQAGVLTVS